MKNGYLRRIAFMFTLLSSTLTSSATHTHGQEAWYQYLGNNRYKVTFTMYQDFRSGDANAIREDNPIFVSVFANGQQSDEIVIQAGYQGRVTEAGPEGCTTGGSPVDLRYSEFTTTLQLPPIPGGYRLKMERCCLGANITNLRNSSSQGLELRMDIPGLDASNNPVQNSSPAFRPLSNIRSCVNQAFQIDFGATDADNDSLVYRIGTPNSGGSNNDAKPVARDFDAMPLAFTPGYSANFPFGNSGFVAIDPSSGRAELSCSDQGLYMVTVACDEYRDGTFLSTVQRSVVVQVTNCVYTVKASILRDSVAILSGVQDLGKVQCGGDATVRFKNTSTGATGYRWDFGDPASSADTSNAFEPEYHYLGPGRYPVTLKATGASCADSIRFWVWIAPDKVQQDFSVSGGPCVGNEFYVEDRSVLEQGMSARYTWRTNAGSYAGKLATINFAGSGEQLVRGVVISDSGCVSILSRSVQVGALDVRIESDTVVRAGTRFRLRAYGANSYIWAPTPLAVSALDQPELEVLIRDKQKSVQLSVTGATLAGCKASDTVDITVSERGYLFVPNAFTPDGDGLNDVLKPYFVDYVLEGFSVFNRRGRRVFYTQQAGASWDGNFNGTAQGMDTYFWMVRLKSISGAQETKSGEVTLIR